MLSKNLRMMFRASMYVDGKYESRRWRSNIALRHTIFLAEDENFISLDEKIWALKQDARVRPKCLNCEKHTSFVSITSGYRTFCSKTCAARSKITTEKKEKTCLTRWKEKHHAKNKAWALEQIRDGHIDGRFKRSYETRVKKENNNPFVIHLDTIKKTMMERYGVDNPLKSEKIKKKKEDTCIDRYGVRHHMQFPEIFEKNQLAMTSNACKLKKFKMPSGDIRYVRGYEPHILQYYLDLGIQESDILTSRATVPAIIYFFEGVSRCYYPDIFISSKNLLVKVKSQYTWGKDKEKNIAKHFAALKAGFGHSVILWNPKYHRIESIPL